MTECPSISALAEALLTKYDFDLGSETSKQLIARWENNYQLEWLCLAVIEALYLGRYKAISVQQILILWKRRGQAIYCLLYTSPSPRDMWTSRMPSSA